MGGFVKVEAMAPLKVSGRGGWGKMGKAPGHGR
jgi:hypothetical protein